VTQSLDTVTGQGPLSLYRETLSLRESSGEHAENAQEQGLGLGAGAAAGHS